MLWKILFFFVKKKPVFVSLVIFMSVVIFFFSRIFYESAIYMRQMTLIDGPMGNCLTCYKVPPPGEPQSAAPIEKDKEGKEM